MSTKKEEEKNNETNEEAKNVKDENKEEKRKNTGEKAILIFLCIFLCFFIAFILGRAFLKNELNQNIVQNEQAIINKEEIIEYGSKFSYEAILEKTVLTEQLSEGTSLQIFINDVQLERGTEYTFNTVGNVKIKLELSTPVIMLKYFEKSINIEQVINWKVEDTKKPVLSGIENKEIKKGETLDIKAGITAKDEIDGELGVTVEGEFDNNKVGEYTLTAKAVDKNQNEVSQTFKVTVKEEEKKEETSKTSSSSSSKTTTSKKTSSSKTTTNKSTSSNKTTTNKSTSSNKNSTSNKNTTSSSSSSSKSTYTSTLKKRGYNRNDKDAAEKDKKATVIVNQIASSIKAKGYKTDLEKVQAAADAVSRYYYKGVHVESGYDYRTPYGVFIKGEASCAGTTRALIQVLEALGYKNLTHANENGWTHQWVILTMDGKKGFADGQVGMVGYGNHPYA